MRPESLEFSRNHFQRYYDSDFFPKLFEFKALWADWDAISNHILETGVDNLEVENLNVQAAPKPDGNFRIVHQLDPINALVYTALAHEVAEIVEENRRPIEEESVFSYRINLTNESFFRDSTGYEEYIDTSRLLAQEYEYVLVTDITDFYNQIYIHRVRNNIESCDDTLANTAQEIENFLMSLNDGTSQGVPVGPSASIIFSECTLIDIDNYISGRGFRYLRYVDDFRIFGNSKIELTTLLNDLSKYLYHNHRLTLSSTKTLIVETDYFIENILNDPEKRLKQNIHQQLNELNQEVGDYPNFEPVELGELPNNEQLRIQAESLQELIEDILRFDKLDLGLSRHILRRAKRLNSRSIYNIVLQNLDFFSPVINDVVLYLIKVSNENVIERASDRYAEALQNCSLRNLPFMKIWLAKLFTSFRTFSQIEDIRQYIFEQCNRRVQALWARRNRDIARVRNLRQDVNRYPANERRAIYFASSILGNDEKTNWMRNVEGNTNNVIDIAVSRYVRSL